MDIRDSQGSKVIQNIMDKKKSEIERESRIVVAENKKAAENAEINALREVDINRQLAEQQVGIKTAEKDKEVGIANELASQEIKMQQKITAEKTMEVARVENVKAAEIAKEVNVVKAQEQKETEVVKAEGEKAKTVLLAEGVLEQEKREAEAILVKGQSNAEAEKLLQLAPVEAQIVLAKEIGENASYQQYLITIRTVEANQAVGIAQAGALDKADVKIIANNGSVVDGLSSVGELFSSKGGTKMAAALEGLAQSDVGKDLLAQFGIGKTEPAPVVVATKTAKTK
jgi:flotillin